MTEIESLLSFFRGLSTKRAHALQRAAEIYRLKTAVRVIRTCLVSGEYDGTFMCLNIRDSDRFSEEEKELAQRTIMNELITGSETLCGYIVGCNQVPQPYAPVHKDYGFMRPYLFDKKIRRILLSNWYFKKCSMLEARIHTLEKTPKWY